MSFRLILVGPPGAGKGTQATLLAEKLDIEHFSTGEMFRSAIKAGTEFGKLAAEYIEKGNFVPDEVTNGLVREKLASFGERGFLLDGYPRNLAQVEFLDEALAADGYAIDAVIEIDVDDDDVVGRLLKRAEIEHRKDDTEEVIRHRIDVYHEQTAPLIEVYSKRGLVKKIDGNGSIDEVHERIMAQFANGCSANATCED